MASTSSRRARQPRSQRGAAAAPPRPVPRPPEQLLLAPLALIGIILLISLTERVQANPILVRSFQGAAAGLLVFAGALYFRLKRGALARGVEVIARPQHYIQSIVQVSVFLYWGWFWRPVYEMAPLIVAQLVFAYAFDMLISWWRREKYLLGFAPFPIILSINLFLWFKDDWFYLQFVMIAVGMLGKEFVRWNREGRNVHIFNPSAFSLGLFSIILIATGTTELTWGPEIASTLSLAPWIYTYLFLGGLVVMYFFSITLLAGAAAATLFGLSAAYSAITGVPYFLDSEIPSAVFLGLHLLITDPSTSPRTPPGKLVFGFLYGVSVFALYSLLTEMGAPTHYDKLMAVPLLNLCVPAIDRVVQSIKPGPLLSRLGLAEFTYRGNLAHMAVWILFFGAMSVLGRTDSRHPGDSLPFWQQACAEDLPRGCERLLLLESTYCNDNSGWACNELGRHYTEGRITEANDVLAVGFYSRACELRFQAGCLNLLDPGSVTQAVPRAFDLRLLLREGGLNLLDMPEPELYARACDHGWAFACERVL